MARIKKAQTGKSVKASPDSTAYYANKYKTKELEALTSNNLSVIRKRFAEKDQANEDRIRQRFKGKPGYDKDGFPVKKQKSGGKTPAWQRKEGKNPSGGLNAKGRASYNRANPGKPGLKAPQPEGGPRKKSFCARMSGMKKKLTSAKTANDPNSRINKSLRKWKC